MNNEIKTTTMAEKYKRWSRSEPTKNGNKTTEVQEIENGFLITVSEYRDKGDCCGDWTDTKTFSKENPLDDSSLVSEVLELIKQAAAE